AEQDLSGNRITAAYTAGRLSNLTHSDGDQLTFLYNAQGLISQVTGPGGVTITYTYDAAGEHLLSVMDAHGTTTYTYLTGQANPAQNNALSEIALPDGTHTFFVYDSQGRLTDRHQDGGMADQ